MADQPLELLPGGEGGEVSLAFKCQEVSLALNCQEVIFLVKCQEVSLLVKCQEVSLVFKCCPLPRLSSTVCVKLDLNETYSFEEALPTCLSLEP